MIWLAAFVGFCVGLIVAVAFFIGWALLGSLSDPLSKDND